MSEIAHGIDVYFESKKKFKNVVFLPDGDKGFYPPGGMLFELISDKAIALASEKPRSMIQLYPGYKEPFSPETITDSFKWLYGTVQDEDLPVATEMFRSSFNSAIQQVLQETETPEELLCVGASMETCLDIHIQTLSVFAAYFDSLAAHESGVADEEQDALAQEFSEFAEEMWDVYTRKCSVRRTEKARTVQLLNISSYLELLTFEYCQMKKKNKVVKICANCGRYFIPPKRNDAIYCVAPAPDDPSQTCKQVGANRRQAKKIKEDPNEGEHHRVASKVGMRIKRAKERGQRPSNKECYDVLEAERKRYETAKAEIEAQGGA